MMKNYHLVKLLGARLLALLLPIALFTSCAIVADSATDLERSSQAYVYQPTRQERLGWIVFLPGASGFNVLGDDQHYVRTAQLLNEQGFDVLLVDYKAAHGAMENPSGRETGEKIAAVTRDAIEWLFEQQPELRHMRGSLVAWSLGAQGVVELVKDEHALQDLRLCAAVLFYPAQDDDVQLDNHVPLLVLSGGDDNVTSAMDVRHFIATRTAEASQVELVVYPKAHHGFDIASLREKKTLRLLPFVGPTATLQYQPEAATDAHKRMIEFLVARVPS